MKGKRQGNIKRNIIILLSLLLIIILAIILYLLFFRSTKCLDENCFSEALIKCNKVNYVYEGNEAFFEYTIKGKKGDYCIVDVKFIQAKYGSIELKNLEGEEMQCKILLGTYIRPEQDIRNCEGILKEKVQEIMLQRMHTEILENMGKINKELEKVL